MKALILGTGMAAWGAFDRFKTEGVTPDIYDAKDVGGGHTASYRLDNGFIFDDGPHISFTENDEIKKLFADSVDGEYESFSAYVDNYYDGGWVEHPVIVNMHELPKKLVTSIVDDFKKVHGKKPDSIENYMDWLVASYGQTYAEIFPATYGLKYHTCRAEEMNTDWMGPRLYQPDLSEVINGSEKKGSANAHYIKEFRYPTRGGFQSYLDKFIETSNPKLSHKAISIDTNEKIVSFNNGVSANYDEIVSSVPLPLLIPMIQGVPTEILEASKLLACSQCVLVNLGVNREDLSPAHWRYIYDLEMDSVRLSFPHMFSPNVAPPGTGAIQVEVYYSDKYKPFDGNTHKVLKTVISNLRKMGIILDSDTILYSEARYVPWGNIIFDLDTRDAASKIHAYLDELQINYCGRYGDWGYIWTDESYLSGQRGAQQALDRVRQL